MQPCCMSHDSSITKKTLLNSEGSDGSGPGGRKIKKLNKMHMFAYKSYSTNKTKTFLCELQCNFKQLRQSFVLIFHLFSVV